MIGEAGQPSQMTPTGARQIGMIEVGQVFGDDGGQVGGKRSVADTDPGLQMTRAGAQHQTGLVALGVHASENVGDGAIEVNEDIAGVLVAGERNNIHIEAIPVAAAEKAHGGWLSQQRSGPQPFARADASIDGMDQANEIEVIGHRRELAAHGLESEKETVVIHGNNFESG